MITPTNRTRFEKNNDNTKKAAFIVLFVLFFLGALGFFFFLDNPLKQFFPDQVVDSSFNESMIRSYWEKQNYRQVYDQCAKQLVLNPMDTSAIMYEGLSSFYIALSLSHPEEKRQYLLVAAEFLRKIPVILPNRNNSDIQYILGKTYYHLGYYYEDQSYSYLLEAEKNGFRSYDLYEYLGLLSSSFSQNDKALSYFKQSLALNDRDVVYLAVANTYDFMGKEDEALHVIDELISRSKDEVLLERAHLKKGDILFRQGKIDDAEKIFSQVLELNAESADAYFNLGEIQASKGDSIKARALWRQAYMIDQKHAGAINRLSS